MKTLVYTTAFGAPLYAEMAAIMIESLRTRGAYSGPLIVLTDGAFATNAAGVEARRVDLGDDPLMRRSAKVFACRFLDPAPYDRVLYLDTDIVARGDITPLFETCPEGGLAAAHEEPFVRVAAESMGTCLTFSERLRHGRKWGLNSGTVCFDARTMARDLDLWRGQLERCRNPSHAFVDQPPFNALVLRKLVRFAPYPLGLIEFPPLYKHFGKGRVFTPTEATRLLHFCGHEDKEQTVRRLRRALATGA